MIRKGVFVKHRFVLKVNGVFDRFKVYRFKKNQIFDDGGHTRYRTDTDVLDGFNASPETGTDKGCPGGASICENRRDVEFEYVKFIFDWDRASSV
jgi:hypothetical protein